MRVEIKNLHPQLNILIFLTLLVIIYIFVTRKRPFKRGFDRVNQFSIRKVYGKIEVTFYHWGSLERFAESRDNYIGFYGLIKTPYELNPLIFELFDDVEHDSTNDGKHLITVKKKKVFLETVEFDHFLSHFDQLLQDVIFTNR